MYSSKSTDAESVRTFQTVRREIYSHLPMYSFCRHFDNYIKEALAIQPTGRPCLVHKGREHRNILAGALSFSDINAYFMRSIVTLPFNGSVDVAVLTNKTADEVLVFAGERQKEFFSEGLIGFELPLEKPADATDDFDVLDLALPRIRTLLLKWDSNAKSVLNGCSWNDLSGCARAFHDRMREVKLQEIAARYVRPCWTPELIQIELKNG